MAALTPAIAISIHTLRVEGDACTRQSRPSGALFQSTPSAWRVTMNLPLLLTDFVFQSTPSAWRVTSGTPFATVGTPLISIHTLRVEGDGYFWLAAPGIHLFQSTPSAWRVTIALAILVPSLEFQSTPSAWRVTNLSDAKKKAENISIHTLRVEGDRLCNCSVSCLHNFNPHPPRGG